MDFKKYLYANPGIQHNVKAIVRLEMLKKKIINSNESYKKVDEIQKIDEKIKINMDLIEKYVKNSYENVDIDELKKCIQQLQESVELNYDSTKSYKENYNKGLNNFSVDISNEVGQNEIDNLDDVEDELDGKDEELYDETVELDDEEIDTDKTLIKYNIKDDMYTIDTPDGNSEMKNIPISMYNQDENMDKRIYGEDYEYLFDDFEKNEIKYRDSRLLFLLWQKMGKEEARKYLDELAKGKDADKENLNYQMTYDIKEIKENKDLSRKEKKNLIKIIRKNKNLAKIVEGKEKSFKRTFSRIGAAFIGITALLGITGAIAENHKQLDVKNKVSDTDLNDKTGDLDKNNNGNESNSKDKQVGNNDKDDFKNQYKVSQDTIDENIKNNQKKIRDEALKQFKLGNSLELGEGINYTEDSMGQGDKGETGVTPWRPAGTYVVNGVSILNSDKKIVTFTYEKDGLDILEYIKSNMPEGGDVRFHIAQLKDGKRNATGWVEKEAIYDAVVENYKNKQNNKKFDMKYEIQK